MTDILKQVDDPRPRSGSWWQFRHDVFNTCIARGLSGCRGLVLKTDLFDEASGHHHHMSSLLQGTTSIGVDLDEHICRLALQRLRQEGGSALLVVADVRRLPFAAESFGGTVSLSTLDHFDRIGEVHTSLREIARILRSGGRFVLALDNPLNPEVALRWWLPAAWVRRLRSNTFTLGLTMGGRQGARELALAGFRVLKVVYLVHPLRYPSIRLSDWAERNRWRRVSRLLKWTMEQAERTRSWPTAPVTGHYVGWICAKGEAEDRHPHGRSVWREGAA